MMDQTADTTQTEKEALTVGVISRKAVNGALWSLEWASDFIAETSSKLVPTRAAKMAALERRNNVLYRKLRLRHDAEKHQGWLAQKIAVNETKLSGLAKKVEDMNIPLRLSTKGLKGILKPLPTVATATVITAVMPIAGVPAGLAVVFGDGARQELGSDFRKTLQKSEFENPQTGEKTKVDLTNPNHIQAVMSDPEFKKHFKANARDLTKQGIKTGVSLGMFVASQGAIQGASDFVSEYGANIADDVATADNISPLAAQFMRFASGPLSRWVIKRGGKTIRTEIADSIDTNLGRNTLFNRWFGTRPDARPKKPA